MRGRGWFAAAVSAAVAAAWFAPAAPAATLASYPDFTSTAGLKLNGDAERVDDVLRLVPALSNETGTAFTRQKVLDPKESFETRFRFFIHDTTSTPGDGVAFILQPGPRTAVGGGGGGMGYSGLDPSLVVEFDSHNNFEFDPPGDYHVAVMRDGDHTDHLAFATPGVALYGNVVRAWIDYSAKRHKLKVFVAGSGGKPDTPLVKYEKNLNRVLGGKARAGFGAATGSGGNAVHDILRWKLKQ